MDIESGEEEYDEEEEEEIEVLEVQNKSDAVDKNIFTQKEIDYIFSEGKKKYEILRQNKKKKKRS